MQTEIKDFKDGIRDTKTTTAADLYKALSEEGVRAYILHFRSRNRPPLTKVFLFNGGLQPAIERARGHCERMDYRFCGCYPFIVDLELQERLRNDELGIGDY